MKKLLFICFLFLLLIQYSCSKPGINPMLVRPDTIVLYNKSLYVINYYVKGRWQLRYMKGGICGSCISARDQYHEYWTFDGDQQITMEIQGSKKIDTSFYWTREKCYYGDTAYVMNINHTVNSNSPRYFIDKLIKDTLVIMEHNVSDPASYLFTKFNP